MPKRSKYEEPYDAVAKLIKNLRFGVIPYEVFKYVSEKFPDQLIKSTLYRFLYSSRYSRKHFYKSNDWKRYAEALLQNEEGRTLFVTGKKKERGVLSTHLSNSTLIIAKNKTLIFIRIFLEIEEVFEKMLKKGHVVKRFGYGVLKFIYEYKKPLSIVEIMRHYKYSLDRYPASTIEYKKQKYKKRTIDPLKKLGFIEEKNQRVQLTEEAKDAFDVLEKHRKRMRVFKWRVSGGWFYPFKK